MGRVSGSANGNLRRGDPQLRNVRAHSSPRIAHPNDNIGMMVVSTIYITRHGFRLNWTVDHRTGTYSSNHPSPTGIASDPPLASYGVSQSKELATYLSSRPAPPISRIYSSPFYRCLQTLQPYVETRAEESERKVRGDNGLGEWYGRARFTHPSPASATLLNELFPFYELDYTPSCIPNKQGETIEELHDRCAYAMSLIIALEDASDSPASKPAVEAHNGRDNDQQRERAILICTHAASMIAISRALTGNMPDDICTDDFQTFTCGVSKFVRRMAPGATSTTSDRPTESKKAIDTRTSALDWKNGRGIAGGWDCVVNCSTEHLAGGAERGWHFDGDEQFLDDEGLFSKDGSTSRDIKL